MSTRLSRLLISCVLLSRPHNISNALRPSQFNNGPITPPSTFDAYSASSTSSPPPTGGLPMDQESVEERLASWRKQQQFKYENQTPIDAANPRDDDGRMKLLASVSKGSISLFFFILMWRSVHHYELADLSFKGTVRLIMVIPTVLLFLGNMIGCVASLMSSTTKSSRNAKKRMKAVLNLNKLVELCLIFYNVLRLIFFPSKKILREIYVGRTLTNFLFIIQCQLFTKVTWGAAQVNPGMMGAQQSSINDEEDSEQINNGYGGGYNEGYPASPQQPQQSYNNDDSNRAQW